MQRNQQQASGRIWGEQEGAWRCMSSRSTAWGTEEKWKVPHREASVACHWNGTQRRERKRAETYTAVLPLAPTDAES